MSGERVTISQASQMLGIPVPTIRSWERRYDFPSPARTSGRHRRYTIAEIESLRAVRDGITRGHPTREAVALVRAAEGAPIDRTEFLDRFTEGATLLDAEKLRAALEDATHLIGVERAITEVAMPGMHEMGDRWRTGRCDVANEHVATQVVRGWLSRLDAQSPPPFHRRPIVLACGPGELHTIGIEAFAVVLGRRGWRCTPLGAMTPAASLATAIRASRAVGGVVTAQRSVSRRAAADALSTASAIPGVTAFYGGSAFAAARSREDVPGIYLGDDLVRGADLLETCLR